MWILSLEERKCGGEGSHVFGELLREKSGLALIKKGQLQWTFARSEGTNRKLDRRISLRDNGWKLPRLRLRFLHGRTQ